MYCTMANMLAQAKAGGTGVPAFNIHALEVVPVMARTAAELHTPVILQVSVSTAKYIGFPLLAAVVRTIAEELEIETALHLDHADKLEDLEAALDGGFTSVMYDGSLLPLEENIQNTQKAVALARAAGASIEAELGIVGRGERVAAYPYTDPEDARLFVRETGVDALAVGIGTHHGQYKAKTEINLEDPPDCGHPTGAPRRHRRAGRGCARLHPPGYAQAEFRHGAERLLGPRGKGGLCPGGARRVPAKAHDLLQRRPGGDHPQEDPAGSVLSARPAIEIRTCIHNR